MTTNLQKGMSMTQNQKVNMVIFIKSKNPWLVLDPDTTRAELLKSVIFVQLALNILAKGDEVYVFFYTDEKQTEIRNNFGQFAKNPELGFTWVDAGILAPEVIRMAKDTSQRKKGETKWFHD